MSHTYVEGDSPTVAARALAAILTDRAEALGSDEFATVRSAMSAVRAGALQLERTFAERGWGGEGIFQWGPALAFDDGDPSANDEHDGHDEAGPGGRDPSRLRRSLH